MAIAHRTRPLAFESNRGQFAPAVKYLARGQGFNLFITDHELVLAVPETDANPDATSASTSAVKPFGSGKARVVRIGLSGAQPGFHGDGIDPLPGRINYFIGNDPSKWHRDITTFAQVVQHNVWPGIDLAWYGNSQQLECDFVVKPGADPGQIALALYGAGKTSLEESGNLKIGLGARTLTLRKPLIYQKSAGGRRLVNSDYALERTAAADRVRFKLGGYDHHQNLVIDPTVSLQYSTYLGGSGPVYWVAGETGYGITVDGTGAAYLTGITWSSNFPGVTSDVVQPQPTAGTDVSMNFNAFIAKFAPGGGSLTYATYLGGAPGAAEAPGALGYGIAVDSAGDAYVVGTTISQGFPLANPYQSDAPFDQSAFLSELNSTGSQLIYSTYFTSKGFGPNAMGCDGRAIAIDSSGSAYITGTVWGTTLPTTKGAFQTTLAGHQNAYMAKINITPSGSTLVYSTYLGGSNADRANAIALDSSDGAYITGFTSSFNFPITAGAYQTALSGPNNAFVTHFSPTGSVVYSTYLGGAGDTSARGDVGNGIAVDTAGNAYVAGRTYSSDFPLLSPLQPTSASSNGTGFVTKLNPTGTALVYSTYLGGSGSVSLFDGDAANAIAVDNFGSAYITGITRSSDFPITNALQSSLDNPNGDAFVTKLDPTGTTLVYSTYLGGSGNASQEVMDGDFGTAIALDPSNNAYVTGQTESPNFPIAAAYQGSLNGTRNAFVAELLYSLTPTTVTWRGGTSNAGNSTESISFSAPSLLHANDVMIAQVVAQNLNTGAITLTPPSGWALVRSDASSSRTQT
jgi:hypothetical protein